MEPITPATITSSDVELVTAALTGDRSALGSIYERHADRVHTMCLHMLRDPDEAADVCGDVFLVAFGRLGQLRDPSRLRSWLFAIARHEVYRRTRRRRRTELVEEVEQMDGIAATEIEEDTADPAELAALVHEAADGLDDRDRIVMELQLQGFDGDELAVALGTSRSTAYQRAHRMRERLERSIGAILVVRQGRDDCDGLSKVLTDWDGTFSVLWRKRVARHVEGCEVCDRRRRAVPTLLLGGGAVAATVAAASPVSAAPASVRQRVLADAVVPIPSGGAGSWRSGRRRDGFPPADRGSHRAALAAALAVAVVVAVLVVLALARGGEEQVELGVAPDPSPVTASASPEQAPSSAETPVVPEMTSAEDVLVDGPAPEVDPGAEAGPPAAPEVLIDDPPSPASGPAPAPDVVPPPAETPAAPPSAPAAPPLPVSWAGVPPSTVFHPTPGQPDCGASVPWVVAAPTASRAELRWSSGGVSGVVELVRSGAGWSGVLEVPASVSGVVSVVGVGFGADSWGVTESITASASGCPVPG